MTEPEDLVWYVVHTNAKAESAVARNLAEIGYQVLFLYDRVMTRHARKEIPTIRSHFPRYVFVGMDPSQGLYAVNTCQGVSTVLHSAGEPLEVPQAVVDELRTRGDEDGMVKDWTKVPDKRRPRFKEGDIVRIGGGPLEGFFAQVALDTGKALKVWLESFGGQVEAVLDPEGCEAVSPAGGTIAFSRRAARR